MLERAVAALGLAPEDSVVDATFGGGGHSRLILAGLGPGGSLVGIDRDPEAAERASDLLQDPRFEFVSGAYDLALWAMVERGRSADAILFDSGSPASRSTRQDVGSHTLTRDCWTCAWTHGRVRRPRTF